mmetsp:Transcript_36287/g.102547  ORF Transcript_36287/g.102547 Transcript_36287/m.102547 type:complete len:487 (-) Transcript_36287:383-1843(-)
MAGVERLLLPGEVLQLPREDVPPQSFGSEAWQEMFAKSPGIVRSMPADGSSQEGSYGELSSGNSSTPTRECPRSLHTKGSRRVSALFSSAYQPLLDAMNRKPRTSDNSVDLSASHYSEDLGSKRRSRRSSVQLMRASGLSENDIHAMQKTVLKSGARPVVEERTLMRILDPDPEVIPLASLVPGNFVGPLAELYPDGIIEPSQKHRRDTVKQEWENVMSANDRWSHPAEASGLATFWQAVLVDIHRVKLSLDSLVPLCDTKYSIPTTMISRIKYPLGQLVNTIGLSWEWHHSRNLEKIGEMARRSINVKSLFHRHNSMQKQLWAVLQRLQEIPEKKPRVKRELIKEIYEDFQRFYVYLLYTVRIVLEDALFFYRKHLHEDELIVLGHAQMRFPDAELVRRAMVLMAGGTPSNQLRRRFSVLGYGWLALQTSLSIDRREYRKSFVEPLHSVRKEAERKLENCPECFEIITAPNGMAAHVEKDLSSSW